MAENQKTNLRKVKNWANFIADKNNWIDEPKKARIYAEKILEVVYGVGEKGFQYTRNHEEAKIKFQQMFRACNGIGRIVRLGYAISSANYDDLTMYATAIERSADKLLKWI